MAHAGHLDSQLGSLGGQEGRDGGRGARWAASPLMVGRHSCRFPGPGPLLSLVEVPGLPVAGRVVAGQWTVKGPVSRRQ